jgi:hypothetical protein
MAKLAGFVVACLNLCYDASVQLKRKKDEAKSGGGAAKSLRSRTAAAAAGSVTMSSSKLMMKSWKSVRVLSILGILSIYFGYF